MSGGVEWMAAAAVLVVAIAATPADAQPNPPGPPASRFEFAAAGTMAGSAELGGGAAALTPNAGGPAFVLFTADGAYAHPVGAELSATYRVAPWFFVGLTGSVSRGDVRVTVGADTEGASAPVFVGESLGQAAAEIRADVLLTRWATVRGRLVPYLTVSGGLFRQWHDEQVIIETGSTVQAGAGVRYRVVHRPRRRLSNVGVAVDVRASRVRGGFHWGREQRTVPSARMTLFTGWGR